MLILDENLRIIEKMSINENNVKNISKNDLLFIEGFEYQLVKDFSIQLPITLDKDIEEQFCTISKDGLLIVKEGFAWDGPSGPTINTANSQIAAIVHDALYRMIRHKTLPYDYKAIADKIFYDLLIEHGMFPLRAWVWYIGVVLFGKKSATKPARVIEIVNTDELKKH